MCIGETNLVASFNFFKLTEQGQMNTLVQSFYASGILKEVAEATRK